MRSHPDCRATAVETREDRVGLIARNAIALGVPRLGLIEGEATHVLDDRDAPAARFVGGGASTPGLVSRCVEALPARGRLVANAVTLEGETALAEFRTKHGGDLTRFSISRAEPVGDFTGWKPSLTGTQYCLVKCR